VGGRATEPGAMEPGVMEPGAMKPEGRAALCWAPRLCSEGIGGIHESSRQEPCVERGGAILRRGLPLEAREEEEVVVGSLGGVP